MAEVKDDEKTFTITLEAIKGFIITGYAITPTGNVAEGVEISVDVTVKNQDSVTREVKVTLIDVEGSDQGICGMSTPGEVIDKEPMLYKNVAGGASTTITVNTVLWCGAMPAKNWKLRVEAWRQT